MAISYMDDVEIRAISKELLSLINDYNSEINNLFKRLSDVPTVTKEWVGKNANFYFNRVSQDKIKYVNFGNNLKSIAYKISYDVNDIVTIINENNKDENDKE